ncbi:MAG: 50S ribosomal protein L5 [Patescibacteria group bacterium]
MTKNTATKENSMATPRVTKVVLNTGIGRIMNQTKNQKEVLQDVTRLFQSLGGQKPQVITSNKSIATFKLRKGMPIGLRITLRGKRAKDFIQRLVSLVLPRVRDFRGIAQSSLSTNSLSLGFREHIVFPEVMNENAKVPFSLQATIVTTSKTQDEARTLFQSLGIRFSALESGKKK